MKQNKNSSYEGFTMSMALVDAVPVLLFCAGGIILFRRLASILFGAGVLLCVLAGSCKVTWKIILALHEKDVARLPKLFRILMPAGFLTILLSVPFNGASWRLILKSLISMPSLGLIIAGCAGMVFMGIFAVKLDGTNARANWIEQLTNTAAQTLFFLAIVLM